MSGMNFEQRCTLAQNSLPQAPYRDQLTALHTEMLARIAELETEAVGYQAELAGYEASIANLDRIISWQGELLQKVKSMLSVDDFGVPLEAGDNPLLDEINEHLEAVNTAPTAKTVEIDRIKTVMELYGWGVTGCLGVYRGEYDKQDAAAMARRLGGASRAFALYREAGSV